ncbi:Halomucin [Frankliniella fusca]|uniref:Halomucin n=1 Tax=Frankliniella fusca TaxID=407009 RepID=A0AAE1LMV2_9NEOP|nr:Halomucin [Frankliniella fusca]
MEWFLIESDEDKSFSIVHHSFVLNAGAVKNSDTVTFFYRNKPFIGTIISSGEREALDEELAKLGQEAKRTTKDPAEEKTSNPVLGKRRSNRPERYGQDEGDIAVPTNKKAKSNNERDIAVPTNKKAKSNKKASEDVQKKNFVESKRKQSHGLTNQDILNWMDNKKHVKEDESQDKEWTPAMENGDEVSSKSPSSTCSDLQKLSQSSVKRKEERVNIIKGIKSLSPSTSPTKEALKIKLRNADLKLQLLYDAEESKASTKSSGKGDGESNKKEKYKSSERKEREDSNNKEKDEKGTERVEKKEANDKGKDEKGSEGMEKKESNDKEKNETSERMEKKDSNNKEKSTESNDVFIDSSNFDDGLQGPDRDNSVNSESFDKSHDKTFDDLEDNGKEQLFGKCPGFVQLVDDIYCHKEVVRDALAKSTNVCHIARRLLVGVFKPESLQSCTLTGQEWRASGDKSKSSEGLYRPAVNAIIEYARTAATARKWKVPKENSKIKHSMACRLCEIKSLIKKDGIDIIKKKYLS